MKQITLGDVAKFTWKAINAHYDEPEFQYFEVSRILYEIKELVKNESITERFADDVLKAFFAKWDGTVYEIDD